MSLLPHVAEGLGHFHHRLLVGYRIKAGQTRSSGTPALRPTPAYPSDKKAKRVLCMHADGLSYWLIGYWLIGRNVSLSKNSVMHIVRRNNGQC